MNRRSPSPALALSVMAVLMGAIQRALAPAVAPACAEEVAEQAQASLYDRLGGLAPISVVVSDFIDPLVPDAVLNANPAIDAARQHVPPPYLKYHVTSMVCQATGGHASTAVAG